MIRRPPRSTRVRSSAASDVYKRQATGYRLAGVEVRVTEAENAASVLDALIEEEAYGLVIVDEGLVPDPVASSARTMRGRDLPVLLPLPSLGAAFGDGAHATEYMK